MATAYDLSCAERPETVRRVAALRDRLRDAVLAVDGAEPTGHPRDRLPGLLSIVVHDTDGSSVALALDLEGIATSIGSACATGSAEVSHVLSAMGYPDDEARGALRISLGRTTTAAEIDLACKVIPPVLQAHRSGAASLAADPLAQAGV
jgi:cysteine desulfurase